jgi:F0F1-type ATP synthase gamma subunit
MPTAPPDPRKQLVSEHASRMTAMDKRPPRTPQELLEQFRLEYNKIRQSKITLELMEIISGSEALQ